MPLEGTVLRHADLPMSSGRSHGVDASQTVACKQVLHSLHVRLKSGLSARECKYLGFKRLRSVSRSPQVLSLLLSQTRFHNHPVIGISLQDEVGISTYLIVAKAALLGRGLHPKFLVNIPKCHWQR